MPDLNKVLTELFNLAAPEVSFVPRGVNQIPFLITKEAGVGTEALKKLIADTKLPNIRKINKVLKELDGDKKDAFTASLRVLRVMKEDEDLSEESLGEILGLAELVEQEDGEAEGEEGELESLKKAMIAKDAEMDELRKELDDLKGGESIDKEDGEHDEEEGIFKEFIKKDGSLNQSTIPEAIRPMINALWGKNRKSEESLAKIAKQLEDEREVRVLKEYDDKASGYKNIEVEGLGVIMKEFAEKSPTHYEKFVAILKVADEGFSKPGGAFGEAGSSRGGSDDGMSRDQYYDKIQARAVSISKEDTSNLTSADKSVLTAKFISSTPEGRQMYSEYKSRV